MVAVIGDGALTAGMAFEALNHAGSPAGRPAGDPQRQRHVDLGERRRAVQLPGARAVRPRVCAPARGRQEGAAADAHRVGTGAPLRGARQGHGAARHAVRGDGLQLHRPDRRPRREGAGAARCATCASCAARSSCTWSRARARATRRPRPIRSSGTARARSIRRAARSSRRRAGPDLLAGLRRVAVRHGRARPAHRRHHAGDARGLGPGRVLASAFRSATSTSPSPSSTR